MDFSQKVSLKTESGFYRKRQKWNSIDFTENCENPKSIILKQINKENQKKFQMRNNLKPRLQRPKNKSEFIKIKVENRENFNKFSNLNIS